MRLAWVLLAGLVACSDDGAGGAGASGGGTTSSSEGGTSAGAGNAGGAAPGGGGAGGVAMGGAGGSGGGSTMVNGFPPAWPDGTSCGSEAPIYVWEYAPDTFILRQSLCTTFEGPFLYLFFGEDKVLLEDTGDGGIPLATTVQSIIDAWLTARGKTSIELVVAHSHGHGDHVAGDGQFAGLANTTVVGTGVSAVQAHFGITDWPEQIVQYDLGGRVLDVIPIPGHHPSHIALYDRRHELLLTGDTLYPGRLYVQDFGAYVASVQRLAAFAERNPVAHVLGTHIEMTTTPGQDFAFGADQHPNEHPLELTVQHLFELRSAVEAMGGTPAYEVHDDFIVYPL